MDGEELKDKEWIKNIRDINEKVSKNKDNKNKIFYMLVIPIKNRINIPFLYKTNILWIFQGINENNTIYFEDISSLIIINNIAFKIYCIPFKFWIYI